MDDISFNDISFDDIIFDLHSVEMKYDKIKLFNETIINYYGLCTILINTPVLKKYIECTGTEFSYNNSGYMKDQSLDKLDPNKNQYCFDVNNKPNQVQGPYNLMFRSNFILSCTLNYNTITIEVIKNRNRGKWIKDVNIIEMKLNILFPESNESETQ